MATDERLETPHFGLTRVGSGEDNSKNGYAVDDSDRLRIDNLFWAALRHSHDGAAQLGDPTDPPTLVAVSTGGGLPAATTYYYRVSFLDKWGMETAASPEASVTTPDPIGPPDPPGATVDNSAGTLGPGIYAYLITFVDAFGGETLPSAMNNVQVTTGTTNRILLDLPALPAGATAINIYRARPGQSLFFQLATNITAITWYDTGVAEDRTIQAPTSDTSNGSNTVQVAIPGGTIPQLCVSWKIYRSTTSGGYDGTSLVHNVVEGQTDTSATPRTMWEDDGDSLEDGFPQNNTSTVPSSPLLTLNALQGTLPLAATPRGSQCFTAHGPGTLVSGQTVTVTETPAGLSPVRVTAFFKTPPAAGETVDIVVADSAATPNQIVLACSTPVAGDPAGYFHAEYPLVAAMQVDADKGTHTSGASVVTDVVSTVGQAVYLSSSGDSVTVDFGALDAGDYNMYIDVRPNQDTAVAGDFQVDVVDATTSTTLSSNSYAIGTLASGYRETVAQSFTNTYTGHDIQVVISKASTGAQQYYVDYARFTASTPQLESGLLTVSVDVPGGTTVAADVNVAVWF